MASKSMSVNVCGAIGLKAPSIADCLTVDLSGSVNKLFDLVAFDLRAQTSPPGIEAPRRKLDSGNQIKSNRTKPNQTNRNQVGSDRTER